MSGKRKKKNRKYILLLTAGSLLAVLLVCILIPKAADTGIPGETVPVESQQESESEDSGLNPKPTVSSEKNRFDSVQTQPQPEGAAMPIELGEGLRIIQIAAYAGLYLEDGSDEPVSDILMMELENTSDRALQLGNITLSYSDAVAEFTVSNLPAGKKVILLEQKRMAYTAAEPIDAKVENTVFLDAFSRYEDQLEIIARDGVINVCNITDRDIEQDIFIYYKNVAGGIYYGGITYRVRIRGGLKAGEIRQLMTEHYDAEGSEILMVSYG